MPLPRGISTGGGGASSVTEAGLTLADNTTDNVTISRHGFAPKGELFGCQLTSSGDLTLTADGTNRYIPWDTEVYDDGGFHEGVTHPQYLSIPTGLGGAGTRFLIQAHFNVSATTNVLTIGLTSGTSRADALLMPFSVFGNWAGELSWVDDAPADGTFYQCFYQKASSNATLNTAFDLVNTNQRVASWFRITKLK